MKNSGLFAFCGVPGSGKTLNATFIALQHYKSENRLYKYLISYLKYLLINNKIYLFILKIIHKIDDFITFIFFTINLNSKYYKMQVIRFKIFTIIFKLIHIFINMFLFLFMLVSHNWYYKILIFIYLFFIKKIFKFISDIDYKYFCMFPYKKINNVYSTFPILLDKKRNIYSHKVTLWDLNNDYSYYPNAIIIVDETQLFVDSDEYKSKITTEKLRPIGYFLQSHRHFGIKNIIFTSQGVTRIFKKARDVCAGYLKMNRVIKIPLLPIGFLSGTMYYDVDYYGKYIPKSREERKKLPFEYSKYFRIVNLSKIYSSYDSRYLANMNYSKPLNNRGVFDTGVVSVNDLNDMFDICE